MIAPIVNWAVHKRWLVLLLTVLAAVIGAAALYRLPIDAVPDITNNQVQINVKAPALSPELVEKQVAFPIETALAGIPGLDNTRSLSRNGFAQITAVFDDKTDIYFARQQVTERLGGVTGNLPSGVSPKWGRSRRALARSICGPSGWSIARMTSICPASPACSPMAATSPRRRPPDERHGEGDLSAHRAGLDRCPLLKNTKGLAGIDSIGGYVKQFQVIPDVQRLAAMGLTLTDLGTALERNNTSVGGGFVNRNGEGLAVRSDAGAQCQ
jgi:cobalt-zinc-cadmium resistance protein CzcA